MQIFNLKRLLSLIDCPIFLKFNRVEAINKTDKLCKFRENLIKNVDFIT